MKNSHLWRKTKSALASAASFACALLVIAPLAGSLDQEARARALHQPRQLRAPELGAVRGRHPGAAPHLPGRDALGGQTLPTQACGGLIGRLGAGVGRDLHPEGTCALVLARPAGLHLRAVSKRKTSASRSAGAGRKARPVGHRRRVGRRLSLRLSSRFKRDRRLRHHRRVDDPALAKKTPAA